MAKHSALGGKGQAMHKLACFAGFLAVVFGCSTSAPQPEFPGLLPVSGTVLQGGKPVAGGVVRFTPEPDTPEFLINSTVDSSGKFSLSTVRTTDTKGERHPGATAGVYRVTYIPLVLDQTTGNLEPITLPKTISITAQRDDLTIELPAR